MDWGALYPEATDARTRDQLAQPKNYAPADKGAFSDFGSGVGNYFMRGMAETARNVSMAGAVVPIVADKLIGSDNMSGESLTDRYFKFHDETFQNAVDYWTPKPGTVGKAGEIVGQLASGLYKFILSPSLAVADTQMSTSIDLTRAGVDTGAALVAGDIAGLSTVAGVALPFVGSTLGKKVASGVVGNLVPNMIEAQAKQSLLKAAGSPDQAAQFDPLDPTARALDILMGMAFGGAAHYMSKTGERKLVFSDDQKNALLTVNQARHMERSADQSNDISVTRHVDDIKTGVEQLLKGEPVSVPDRGRFDPNSPSLTDPIPPRIKAETAEIQSEIVRLASEDAKPVIEAPAKAPVDVAAKPNANPEAPLDPAAMAARQAIADAPDLRIPTGEVHPDGTDVTVKASDYIAKAEADAASVETRANLFRTAAECLLGAL